MINQLAKEIHQNNIDKGFYEGEKNIGEMLMLIVTEVAEACECDRKDQYTNWDNFNRELKAQDKGHHKDAWQYAFKSHIKDTFEDEIADVMIRCMDLAAFKGIDLEAHIKAKMRYNSLREYKHGKKY